MLNHETCIDVSRKVIQNTIRATINVHDLAQKIKSPQSAGLSESLDKPIGPFDAGTPKSNFLNVWPLNVGWTSDIELDGGAASFSGDYLFLNLKPRFKKPKGGGGIAET